MNRFWDLLQESTLLQAAITLIVVSGVVYMYATEQAVPSELNQLMAIVLGFYFGGKIENTKMKAAVDRMVEKKSIEG